jgi:hypothetical protein
MENDQSEIRSPFLLIAIPIAAHADAGKIRICRDPGLTELMDDKSVSIPAGSHFEHSALSHPGGKMQHVIVTSGRVTIGPKPACTIVSAKEEENFAHKPITTKTGQLCPQFSIAGLSVFAVAIEDFH